MKNIIKALFLCLFISITAFCLISCKNNDEESKLITPNETYIIESLQNVPLILDIEAVTEKNDPNGQLNKEHSYISHVYFSYELVNQNEVSGTSLIEKGTDAGGSIEVYRSKEDAKKRDEYLTAFDGTILDSGSHTIAGTCIIRTSNKLTASEQRILEANLIFAIKGKTDDIVQQSVNISYYDGDVLLHTEKTNTNTSFEANWKYQKTGYSFIEWQNKDGKKFTPHIIRHSEDIFAHTEINQYKITFDENGGSSVDDIVKNYNESVLLPVTEKEGYSFAGWYQGSIKYTSTKMPATNLTLKAEWEIEKYEILAEPNYINAGKVSGGGSYNYNTTATLKVTDYGNLGYIWDGWYDIEGKCISKDLTINYTIPSKNSTLVAKWQKDDKLKNFNFTSTKTTLELTGIVDTNITSLEIPDIVTSISSGALMHCENLQELSIPFIGNNLKNTANNTFSYIFGLSDFIPETLKKVTVRNSTTIPVGAFSNCEYIKTIILSENVTSIGAAAFASCRSLEDFQIPNKLTEIKHTTFISCISLKTITIPKNVETIGEGAFAHCRALKNVVMEDGVKRIGSAAFQTCKLETIELPSSLEYIGDLAFDSITTETIITYRGTSSEWSSMNKHKYWDVYTDECVIICSDKTIIKSEGLIWT